MKVSPFDHRQDSELGDALRSALTGSDEEAFVQRVVAAATEMNLRSEVGGDWLDILSAWAKPGLVAAAIGTIAAAVFWWSYSQAPAAPEIALFDALEASVEIPAEFLTSQAPDLNEVLALELGN
jgi:hypothetical protein